MGAVFIVAFGLIIIIISLYEYAQIAKRIIWPKVDGSIIKSNAGKFITASGSLSWTTNLCYYYHVNGKTYIGNRVAVWHYYYSKIKANQMQAKYPVGLHVIVYYNPKNPSDAYLEPDNTSGPITALIFGVVFTAIGLGVWIMSLMGIGTDKMGTDVPGANIPGAF